MIDISNAGNQGRVAAVVSDRTSPDQLKRLKAADVRFVRVNLTELGKIVNAKQKDPYLEQFRIKTYVMMLAMRYLNEQTMCDANGALSDAYRTVEFYLRTHFGLDEISPEQYINAMISEDPNDISLLIKAHLLYRPAEPYNAREDYEAIAPALLSV